jgi:hypothetical protein
VAVGQSADGAEQVSDGASSAGQEGGGQQNHEASEGGLGENGSQRQQQRFGFGG